jgi:DNA-binding CsgD family transcriptional regulator/tetratricopeptide (TPR) repeat protein
MTAVETLSLASDVKPLCSLSLHVRRISESVVGRPLELAAVEKAILTAKNSLAGLTLEGEPGIGKTRLLIAASEIASATGFLTIGVMADEQIRGPFLLARSIFASGEAQRAARDTPAEEPLRRALDAVSGNDDPGLAELPPDQKLLRAFDLASLAVRALAKLRPVALLIDDLQWADEDSIRLLRYLVRTGGDEPIFLMAAMRPEETALVNEAVTLIADMERMGLVRRLKVGRLTQLETAELCRHLLGGKVHGPSAATVQAQAEGVPFVVEELVHAYRDNGMIQQIDGMWTLAQNVDRLMPSAVKTLIQRRAAHLPDDARDALGEAAVLGRTFSLRDLREIRTRLNGDDAADLGELLTPGVEAGLLMEHPPSSPADYSFTHEQVREFAAATLPAARRRAVHRAVVDMLIAGGDPPAGSLPLITHHALAAGDAERAAQWSLAAARAALDSHAPEEGLRLVELALPIVSGAEDRIALLIVRDEALEMLQRPGERLEGLAELNALTEALGDPHRELDVMLRRAAALRAATEDDRAAEVARRVIAAALRTDDKRAELEAQLELGQALLRVPIGEGYTPNPTESDFEGASQAYHRALELAEELEDDSRIAAAERELGVIATGHVRTWFIEQVKNGSYPDYMRRVVGGELIEDILPSLPIAPWAQESMERLHRAIQLYEKLGDRRGLMSSIIALAYVSWAPDIHMPGSAKRIEDIRKLATQMYSLTKESEREIAEAQMLYGVHVYSRAKIFPDLAITRGEEAYQAARRMGDRSLEFAAAGGTGMAYSEIGDEAEAMQWLDRAAAVAATAPTPHRARQIELWRGMARAAAGDGLGMRQHLDRAVQLSLDHGRPAARCQSLAWLASSAAELGASSGDEELIELAVRSALDAKMIASILPGHAPWGPQSDAALARAALARGQNEEAAVAARSAITELDSFHREDAQLVIVLPAARALLEAGSDEEKEQTRGRLQFMLGAYAQRILDQSVRVRWLRGPWGSVLAELAGPIQIQPMNAPAGAGSEEQTRLLTLLVQGKTNQEIADEIGTTEEAITLQLSELFARMGASSRAEATAFALMGRMI